MTFECCINISSFIPFRSVAAYVITYSYCEYDPSTMENDIRFKLQLKNHSVCIIFCSFATNAMARRNNFACRDDITKGPTPEELGFVQYKNGNKRYSKWANYTFRIENISIGNSHINITKLFTVNRMHQNVLNID